MWRRRASSAERDTKLQNVRTDLLRFTFSWLPAEEPSEGDNSRIAPVGSPLSRQAGDLVGRLDLTECGVKTEQELQRKRHEDRGTHTHTHRERQSSPSDFERCHSHGCVAALIVAAAVVVDYCCCDKAVKRCPCPPFAFDSLYHCVFNQLHLIFLSVSLVISLGRPSARSVTAICWQT